MEQVRRNESKNYENVEWKKKGIEELLHVKTGGVGWENATVSHKCSIFFKKNGALV